MRQLRQALEEARLQGRGLIFPAPDGDAMSILAAHRAHARRASVSAMLSLPILLNGETLGVVGIERMRADSADAGRFTADEIALAEAIVAATAPVIRFKRRAQRLLSGRLPEWIAEGWRRAFGPRYPVLKLALAAGAVAIAALSLATTTLNIDTRAVTKSTVQLAVVAPFDGYVASAALRAGDRVAQGDVLAVLDDADLKLEVIRWESEIARLNQERRQMLAEGDRVGVALATAREAGARAELELAQSRLARIALRAPFGGLIVEGDLTQRLGAPVGEGDVLFEIASGADYKVALHVSEYDVALLQAGSSGQLLLLGLSGEPIAIALADISPVAELGQDGNIFLAEAALPSGVEGMRPGLEGTAKIAAGEAPLLYALARPLLMRLRYLF
jgi:multidrug efflux pump subunit AcrA (membrane-fusion protein)